MIADIVLRMELSYLELMVLYPESAEGSARLYCENEDKMKTWLSVQC